jgi:Bax protein
MMFVALFSGSARAYQYGYAAPASNNAARGYYQPYARAPYPYSYASHRYRVQPLYARLNMPAQAAVVESSNRRKREITSSANISRAPDEATQVVAATGVGEAGSSDKKQAFINALLPYIERENRRLNTMRNKVEGIVDRLESNVALEQPEQQLLSKLAGQYRVNGDPLQDATARQDLLRKIDIIPASMALAQAANESAWGESRFALEANNLFGIWTYDEDKGLKPRHREAGKTHLVRVFDDIGESVRFYMHTLNSHPAYRGMRDIRYQQRRANQAIDGHALAAGLEKYSARGQVYIELIQDLIRQNEWTQLDSDDQST